ncbi:MAG: chromosome segregation protein SMC [Gemmatimonadales bacterium]|nr:MAG: chromosome segregation protein SMC [Gemmatimonadales bacterium]
MGRRDGCVRRHRDPGRAGNDPCRPGFARRETGTRGGRGDCRLRSCAAGRASAESGGAAHLAPSLPVGAPPGDPGPRRACRCDLVRLDRDPRGGPSGAGRLQRMKLRALRLHGFKSFADRTEVVFHDGLTAVVGPNGCGKSNISDAIRWVLGEQRASAIRGARMEEAIFQGTVNRRPVNRGSVALELSNEDGALPVPYGEVEIARTVYRDGGSEYMLNRSPCRLKDIQELYRDTGIGSNAYSIIESRMIDTILSDRADERRSLFEEAAGIGKYKDRRKSAGRRLERAEVDLQRLEDLLSEVESKVRSLSRQKGKAERWGELRKRRLDTELSLARRQLGAFELRRAEISTALSEDSTFETTRSSGLQAAEARLETLRIERVRLERSRSEAAAARDALRTELVRWERELAVAAERGGNAEQRLGRIHGERQEAIRRRDEAGAEREGLDGKESGVEEQLAAVAQALGSAREVSGQVRGRLAGSRAELERVELREREIARRQAQLGGDAEGADARREEMATRLRLLEEEERLARSELAEMDGQGDLFTDRLAALAASEASERKAVETGRAGLDALRAAVDEARKAESAAQERSATLSGRRAALERMEKDREGMDPVVRKLLEAGIPGVHGILLDALSAPVDLAEAVERYLGTLARAVVVEDRAVAARVSRWFAENWKKGGGLVMLPLDALPPAGSAGAGAAPAGSLLASVEPRGEGAPWIHALLAGVALAEADDDETSGGLPQGPGARVTRRGVVVDGRGVVRLGNPTGVSGLLERKEQLRELRKAAAAAAAASDAAREAREAAQAALRAAETSLEEARRTLRAAEDAHREARSEDLARTHRRERILRVLEDVERQVEATRTAGTRAVERAEAARGERDALGGEIARLQAEREAAQAQVEEIQEAWEVARAEEGRLGVEEARLQAERTRLQERLRDLDAAGKTAAARLEALDREEVELRAHVETATRVRREGKGAMEALFEKREAAEAGLADLDRRWAELEDAVTAAEKAVREARDAERAASDRRHRLELEAGELDGRIGRIQERLEGEWGRPMARLLEEAAELEGTEEELRTEAREVAEALDRLGPVNQLAVEEHEEESARLSFLKEQHDDLVKARNDLRAAIREINLTATRLFHETFEKIRENFRTTFQRLFEGGECDLWLEDPEDPLDSAIEIQASPRGKKTQRIDLLSGGERALTALSLLFGIYLVKPSPFCVLDEVDAPLDESNIGRFIHLLQEFKADTQFVVITHNPRTIEAADWIYGVTMEEPGVSRIVGVKLEDAFEVAGISA